MEKETTEELVKVNYEISLAAKENLTRLKKEFKMPISALVDSLLRFDENSVEKFIEIYKKINHEKINKYNYLSVEGGGLVLTSETMKKIVKSNILRLSEVQVLEQGVKNINLPKNEKEDQSYINKFYSDGEFDILGIIKELEIHQNAILTINSRSEKLKTEIERLKK